ncbi:hypothetical protein BC834DRAFT_881462 [Gloeopeniophorella convolvens]|nr:hypothetical protein BC834DRAFT_881462 [Gloeopeniophorella convolvens]
MRPCHLFLMLVSHTQGYLYATYVHAILSLVWATAITKSLPRLFNLREHWSLPPSSTLSFIPPQNICIKVGLPGHIIAVLYY